MHGKEHRPFIHGGTHFPHLLACLPCVLKVLGPLAATTDYDEPAGSAAPADADEAELAALQVKTWAAASLAVAGFRIQGIKGRVGGYGSCSFKVSFTPQVSGRCQFRGHGPCIDELTQLAERLQLKAHLAPGKQALSTPGKS